MTNKLMLPPAEDELEVSLFGPGVGECVVLHLGGNSWMVVDSCIDRETGNPVALDYLEKLGVDVSHAVKLVVITHWHNDHARGAAKVLEAASSAELVCSLALRREEFKTLLGASRADPLAEMGVEEFRAAFEVLIERRKGKRIQATAPIWANANKCLFRSGHITVYALSPSDATLGLSLHEIGKLLPKRSAHKRRGVAQSSNEVSVVLWVAIGRVRALLGADLENSTDHRLGWRAIVDSPQRQPGQASIIKIPHHGSSNSDEPRVWAEMLTANPYAILTPYLAGREPLPTAKDRQRILTCTSRFYQTCPSRWKKPLDLPSPVRKLIRRVAPNMRDAEGPMGHVRLRARTDKPEFSAELFGRAEQVRATT